MRQMVFVFGWSVVLVVLIACNSAPASLPPTGSPGATLAPQTANAPSATPIPAPTKTPASTFKVLRVGLTGYPDALDPQRFVLGSEVHVLKLIYEGLTTLDEKGNVQPGGADQWTFAPDGTQLTFHIRAGMKRADGTPVTAKDYDYALKRALDPRIPDKQNTALLYDIKGAQELDQTDPTKTRPEDIDKAISNLGIKASDDRTLVITFKKPVGYYWLYVAASLAAYPSDKKQVDRDPDNWWARFDGHNGTGAFVVKSFEQGKRIVLAPNPNYWRGQAKLDRLELVYAANPKPLLAAYQKGDLDLVALAPDDAATVAADATLKTELVRYPTAIVYALAFNAARKPFDDKNVRVAFSQAFDRVGWIRDVFKGNGKVYGRWIPPGVPGAQPGNPGVPGYDPQAAVLTLVNNGYAAKDSTADKPKVDCAKLGDITLTYLASPVSQTRFGFIATNLAQAFGCPITLDPVEPAALKSIPRDPKLKPQISLQGFVPDYAYPQDWLSLYWTCGNEFSARYGYCNQNLDALLGKADAERDPQKALGLYQQAEEMLLKDVPGAFANTTENISLVKPYVLGLKDHTSSSDTEWAGEWGPAWNYDINLSAVPANYPQK